uniref:IGFBP N-terminal domain-containing protein n=1 Tax=Magallana gigas TaxID=29159 RepID=A0A8W8LWZ1_MAGGI
MENCCILRLFILVSLGSSMTLACGKCDPDVPCPPLPSKNCDVVQRPCHCCRECARRLGDNCSWATARVIQPIVVENTDVMERRQRI